METPLLSIKQFNRIRRFLPVRKHKKLLDARMVLSAIFSSLDMGWHGDIYLNFMVIGDLYIQNSGVGAKLALFKKSSRPLPPGCPNGV